MSLSSQQELIVNSSSKVCLVIAGPGSGKTRVLTHKVARLIESGVDERSIMLLTFTNKAARNMLERVRALTGREPLITGGTFHHVANIFLRSHAESLGYRKNYSIIDEQDCHSLIRKIMRECFQEHAKQLPKPQVVHKILSYCTNSMQDIPSYLRSSNRKYSGVSLLIAKIGEEYRRRKLASNIMDFDDLLTNFNRLLDDPGFKTMVHGRYTGILVDELQDTNRLQFDIIRNLHAEGGLLFAVGDDCQSIYSFRAAEIGNMFRFAQVFGGTETFYLTENYRSTGEIVSLVNEIIKKNRKRFDKKLLPVSRGRSSLPKVSMLESVRSEARHITGRVGEMLSSGVRPEDIAVLYRSNFQSPYLEVELSRRGIPYVKQGGLKFFEQAHVKDIISFLKISANMTDPVAWERLLRLFGGVGPVTAGKIWNEISMHERPLDHLLSLGCRGLPIVAHSVLAKATGGTHTANAKSFLKEFYGDYVRTEYPDSHEDRLDDISQLIAMLSHYGTLDSFLEDAMLDAGVMDGDCQKGRLTLSTIHQAKGLEWDNVFVMGLAEERFPSRHALGNDERIEEERRLFYVACSRAVKSLEITVPLGEGGSWDYERQLEPSQFVRELSRANCIFTSHKRARPKQLGAGFISADNLV